MPDRIHVAGLAVVGERRPSSNRRAPSCPWSGEPSATWLVRSAAVPAPSLTPTSYVVLGLVGAFGPCTSYDMKRAVSTSIGYFWPFPHSQLYAEPVRLAALGLLSEQQETGGRKRRTYTLTAAGTEALRDWLAEPTDEPTEIRDLSLLKLFFGAQADEGDMRGLGRARHRCAPPPPGRVRVDRHRSRASNPTSAPPSRWASDSNEPPSSSGTNSPTTDPAAKPMRRRAATERQRCERSGKAPAERGAASTTGRSGLRRSTSERAVQPPAARPAPNSTRSERFPFRTKPYGRLAHIEVFQ